MYFITTFTKMEEDRNSFWDFGNQRTPVYYTKLEDARDAVINNACDMYETIYEFALIEEIEPNCFYPECTLKELYQVTKGGKYIDIKYEKIDLPDNFPEYFSIVIG